MPLVVAPRNRLPVAALKATSSARPFSQAISSHGDKITIAFDALAVYARLQKLVDNPRAERLGRTLESRSQQWRNSYI
jgi:hypothetical protein